MRKEYLHLVFGLKIRLFRQQKGLTLQQLAALTNTTVSYLHDMESGKKYPSQDKILVLAQALETDYDTLVSPRSVKKLLPVIDLLESDVFKIYPLEMFGLKPEKVIELLAASPEKVSAFIGAVLKIGRNYHLTRESIHQAALRSYQGLHDNYFPDIESAAQAFRRQQGWADQQNALKTEALEKALAECYGIDIDRKVLAGEPDLQSIRSYYIPAKNTLYLNRGLSSAQENFLIGREIGFQALNIQDNRPFETIIQQAEHFDKLLNNFRASYFSSALLMDQDVLADSLRQWTSLLHWRPDNWLDLLDRFDVTPEMLLQRLTNILPFHFGLKDLFFIRMVGNTALDSFEMSKELHLGGQQSPYATEHGDHYCRRWISIDILRQIRQSPPQGILVTAQKSAYWQTDRVYFCLSMSQASRPDVSVTLGLLHNDSLRRHFPQVDDPALLQKTVNTTCESCSVPDCAERAAQPTEVQGAEKLQRISNALQKLH